VGDDAPTAAQARARLLAAVRAASSTLAASELGQTELDGELEVEVAELLEALVAAAGVSGAAAARLVEIDREAALGRLAAGAAHEINNPLFAILSLAEFLTADIQRGTKAWDRLELLRQSGSEIKEIARALLDFAHEPLDETGAVSLERAARETLDLVGRTNLAKSVEIVDRVGSGSTLVAGSSGRLKQVLLSLLVASGDAMPAGGTITVEVARDGDVAVATVAGEGPGPRSRIRLAVARGVTRLHGGELVSEGPRLALRLPILGEGS
jgi:signal transduction histidine kinase